MGTYNPGDYNGPGWQPQPPVPLTPPPMAVPQLQQKNFNPPPNIPSFWTRSDQPGSRAQHALDPSNYDRPGGTQTAAVPPPPPPAPPGENIHSPTPPTPGQYTPVPWANPHQNPDEKPEPAAKPAPPLGSWTPDKTVPEHQVVKTIPGGTVPNREPDAYQNGRPVYYPRAGEQGYNAPHPAGQPFTYAEQLALAQQAGFTGQAAYIAAALGMSESRGYANRVHLQDGGKPWASYGLMQINGNPQNEALLRQYGLSAQAAVNPLASYRAAYILSRGGTDFSPWTTYKDGSYRSYLDPRAQPQPGSPVAGPVQQYMPPRPREAGQWGSEPEHDWTPGRMPQAHDMPGIMKGLLPLIGTILIGFAGKGALGAVTAFSAYQNARNKGQLEQAREQKTYWRDHLAETSAALKEELLGASGVVSQFGYDASSPQAQRAWTDLANKYDDPQLRAAIANGDSGAIKRLFDSRDAAFQTLSKTSASQDRADTELADKERKANDVNAGLGIPPQPVREPGGGTQQQERGWAIPPGATPQGAPAEPAPPAAPPGEQPAPSESQPPEPAPPAAPSGAPPAPSESALPEPAPPAAPPTPGRIPATGPAGVTPPAPGGTPRGATPAPPSGGTTTPSADAPPAVPGAAPGTTLPPVSVSALPPGDPLARLSPQEQSIARDVLAGGEMPKFPPEAAASETRIAGAVAGLNQQLRWVGNNPNLRDEQSVIGAVSRIDPITADNLAMIAHNKLPLPGGAGGASGGTGSRSVLGYRNLMSVLAQKVNPNWDPGQWGAIEKFRDPDGQVQKAIGRIAAIGDAGTRLKYYLDLIKADPAKSDPTTFARMVEEWRTQHFTDDPIYSNMFQAWQTMMIDSNALTSGGGGLEGETEQIIKSIPLYGNPNSYLGALKLHSSFALSRYQQYQNQWSQLQRDDKMFGHNDVAEKQVTTLANLPEATATTGAPAPAAPGGGGWKIEPVH